MPAKLDKVCAKNIYLHFHSEHIDTQDIDFQKPLKFRPLWNKFLYIFH